MRGFFALVLSAAIALGATIGSTGQATADDDLKKTAHVALIAYTKATLAGTKVLAPMLAPEFQIMRANGAGFDRNGYLNKGVGKITGRPDFSHEDIIATQHGDIMVVRYFLRIDEVIEGQPVKKRAPRLTVFRKVDGRWNVVAHANFGLAK